MPSKNFPGPAYDNIRDSDPQIKRVNLDHAEIASRKSTEPEKMDEGMAIGHVPSQNK